MYERDEYGNPKYIEVVRDCGCQGQFGIYCWDCGSETGTYTEWVENDEYTGN